MKTVGKVLSAIFLLISSHAFATAYNIPPSSESLIGKVQFSSTSWGDTATAVAQRYDVGFNAVESANPQLDMGRAFSSGALIQIPSQHLLPDRAARTGIVINLPEMRMYYYVGDKVYTYPIGIGKIGKTIPITETLITKKTKDPTWIPPEDIREFNLKQGIVLPKIMPPGPDNPLGPYAIYMRIPTYLIHSTIFPESIGKRASFGCIRMYETDIKSFFPSINTGIPVAILNSPHKVGWQDNRLYLEAHRPLEEHSDAFEATLPGVVHDVAVASKNHLTLVDWQMVSYLSRTRDGVPHEIGVRIK